MVKSSDPLISTVVILLLIISPPCLCLITTSESSSCSFKSIISFGDSLADTGNLVRLNETSRQPPSARRPYGRTFFHHPTGRYSDGRLVIDFIAESLQLPYVEPYMEGNVKEFGKGVNFAVAGATALDHTFFDERGMPNQITNVSLGTQFDWLKQFLATNPAAKAYLEKSLISFGEIGGNDYNHPIDDWGADLRVVRSFAPKVVNYMGSTIQELIELGAKTLLVPGNLPIGCLPVYLTRFEASKKDDYNPETGCIKWLNEFSEYHNELLKNELQRIRRLHPQATIIYADYYNAAMRAYRSPDEFGFSKETILKACCGSGGPYNYNTYAKCATSPAVCCDDPSKYFSWDGLHCTEAANKLIAKGLFEGAYTIPQFKTVCSPSSIIPAGIAAQ